MTPHDPDHGLAAIRHLLHEQTAKGLSAPVRDRERLTRQLSELRVAVAEQFADLNGWQLYQPGCSFRPGDIGRRSGQTFTGGCIEHALYFRGTGVCAAIASQPYDEVEDQAEKLAERYSLTLHVAPHPKSSIWFPGWARFLVLTKPGHRVCWLPEQLFGMVKLRPVLTVVR
jgi:hypothetical protein